jgi:hypothetical protein
MTDLSRDDDLAAIREHLASWTKYTFGTPPGSEAVAYATKRDEHWYVFAAFRDRAFAAYVTTPHTKNPIRPKYVNWQARYTTARAVILDLIDVTPERFLKEPVMIHPECTLPDILPRVQR